ncbi:methylation-associated defense system AAA family ATPase MAD3 [Streptomyces gibsoniae]|uniref:AAA family ATPase n=1 Tax=Streptomyces gibsoniae TaxID=3075529 RepID=A0ABU2U6M5_9ACTN|nr:AAA family ATPase [Streptomyces sp. DSM 41699]MDT0468730.1 AAA family ATPase [Streptomyces sp. DSM 41699]
MITRVEAYQYRCFQKLAVDLGHFHVLAGPNGAGKTTLLDITGLIGDLLRQRRIADAFLIAQDGMPAPRAHTLQELVHCGRGKEFTLTVEARLDDEVARRLASESTGTWNRNPPTHLRYELRLEIFNERELHVAEEYLYFFDEHRGAPELGVVLQGRPQGSSRTGPRRGWRYVIRREQGRPAYFLPELTSRGSGERRVQPDQLALSTLPYDREQYGATLWFMDLLQQDAVSYNPDWTALRQASPPGSALQLQSDGRNTPWLALDLQQNQPEQFRAWVQHVQTALPQVENIEVRVREDDRYAYFDVRNRGGHQVTSSGLSDGTLRVLAFTLLPYLPRPPKLIVTEEPENGIHPRAIETVVQSLNSLYDSQVWVSTHSPLVLANVDLADVLAARMSQFGQVTVVPGDQHPRLKDWQGALDIGTLFAAGVLG